MWCFEHVCKRRAPLFNWTGGTEISGGILIGTPIHPLKPCAFGGPVPGMEADIFDEAGKPTPPGEVGELVLKAPSLGLTRGLWKDSERYIESYWSTYDDVWRHGDWASRDADGMWFVPGRSDDTLKIAGKRTGPAEIEGLVMATGLVSEAAAIGLHDDRAGQQVMCVCVTAPNVAADEDTAGKVRDAVADGLGRAFRPAHVLFVQDLPKTRNMKIMRRVVRAAVEGKDPGDMTIAGAFENDPFSQDIRAGVIADAEEYGMEMVVDDQLPPELNDMASTLIKVKATQPDLVVVSGHAKGAALAIRQIAEMQVNVPMLAMTHCDSADIIGNFGADAEYTLCASQWAPSLSYEDEYFGSASNFAKEFEERYDYAPPYQAAESAAAVLVFKDAFERAGSLDKDAVRDALAATDMMTFYGPVKFDETGKNIAKPMVLYQVQDGEYVVVAPTKWAAAEIRYPIPAWSERE